MCAGTLHNLLPISGHYRRCGAERLRLPIWRHHGGARLLWLLRIRHHRGAPRLPAILRLHVLHPTVLLPAVLLRAVL